VPIHLSSELVRVKFAKLRREIQHPNCPMMQGEFGTTEMTVSSAFAPAIQWLQRKRLQALLTIEGVKCQSSCPSLANASRRIWNVTVIGKMFSYLSDYSCFA
jgi:hypothetical protein